MPSKQHGWDARRARPWIGAVLCMIAVGIIAVVVPRLAPRSPAAIVLLCALALLTMKLVERRVQQFFRRWAERRAAQAVPPKRRQGS